MRPGRAYLGAAIAVALGGCGTPSTGSTFSVIDSAGVQIIEWAGNPDDAPTWTVADEPVVTVPSVGPGYELFRVGAVRPLGSDRFVVANGGSQELLVFSLAGDLVRKIGGAGEGPGEFQGLETVFVSAQGALVAADFPAQRITHFDSTGTFIESVRMESSEAFSYVFLRSYLDDGRSLGRVAISPLRPESVAGLVDWPMEMVWVERDGRVGAPIEIGRTQFFFHEVDGRLSAFSYPLRELWELMSSGGRLYAVASAELGVRELSLDGRLRRIIRRSERPRGMSDDEWDRIVENELESFAEDRARSVRGAYEAMPRQVAWPLSDGAVVDSQGLAWVKHFEMPGQTVQHWSVFDLEAEEFRSEVELPLGLDVRTIANDLVFGTRESDLGEETVEVRRIVR